MKRKHLYHIIFWFFYFWYGVVIDKINDPETHIISEVLYLTTHNIYLFYSFLYIFRFAASRIDRKYISAIGLFCLNIALFVGMRYVLRFYIIPAIGIPEPASMDLVVHFTNGILWIVNYLLLSAGYFYFTQAIEKEKQLRLMQTLSQEQLLEVSALKQRELESAREKLEMENAYLRAQINPHFLFNTLGYFHNKTVDTLPAVAEGIAGLTTIMRSAIRTPDPDGLIPIEEEIEHIERLIGIYRLRYETGLYIFFLHHSHFNGIRIVPHVLITLVENALKHGDMQDEEFPIVINLNVSDNIHFTTQNRKRIGPKELSHGIGITYVKKLLESRYEGAILKIKENDFSYLASLTIPINPYPELKKTIHD